MADAPLVDAWRRARERGLRPLQIPGHKYRYAEGADALGAEVLGPLIRDDIALQGGADDVHYTGQVLERAEQAWAAAVSADQARFLVGGSSQGNISALLAVSGPGTPIAVDRTSHRSALAGLVASGAMPVWVNPAVHPEFGLPLGISAADIDALDRAIGAVFATTPSYAGTLADVPSLATACHAGERTLVIDQAWGAHLLFLPGMGALAGGADLVTTSIHKALMGYSQTAVIARRGVRVDPARLDRAVDLTATTSPSATLMASIDATRVVMERDGRAALDRAIESVAGMRTILRAVPGLVVLDDRELGCATDPLKLTLWLPRTGVSGTTLADRLWAQGNGVESADTDTIVMTMSILDEPSFCRASADMLAGLIDEMRGEPRPPAPAALWQVVPEVVMSPRDAWFAPRRRIPMADAVGEVSAEQFCPYPPGVPLLAPGERVTAAIVRDIVEAGRVGRVAYCGDPTLATIEIVA